MNGIISLKKKAEHGLAPVRVLAVLQRHVLFWPVPVAVRSKAWVCGHSPAEIVGSNPTEDMNVCLL